MKFRVHEWIDTDKGQVHFGIQVRPTPTQRWVHCVNGDQVLLYKTLEAAQEAVAVLRAKAAERSAA